MKRAMVSCGVMLAALLTAAAADDGGPAIRRVKLPDHGALDLPAPPTWRITAESFLGWLAPKISFSPPEGKAFSVSITVSWASNDDPHFNDPKTVLKAVTKVRDLAVDGATTRHIPILEIKGEELSGHYFTATVREPRPDDWRYMTVGAAALKDLLLKFAIYSNDPGQPEAASALAMLQKARRVEQ